MVIFESKNWIVVYLKVPLKIGVYYVIFSKENYYELFELTSQHPQRHKGIEKERERDGRR